MTSTDTSMNTRTLPPLFRMPRTLLVLAMAAFISIMSFSCHESQKTATGDDLPNRFSLFDGEHLGNWKITDFGGQGKVSVKDGAIQLPAGNDMTGVTWSGPVVRRDYQITLEAMRVSGSDFFCALTFPIDSNSCSLVLGGWGGSVCGISNIDYYDAADNETTAFRNFDNGKWYHVKVVVRANRIKAWVDDEELVNVDITGRRIDTRFEVDLCKPLGLATWQTYGAIRNIWVQKLPPQPESADEQ